MSSRLTYLFAQMQATRDPGWFAELRAAAEAAYRAYRAYAREIAGGLPFPHSLVRVERTDYTSMLPVVHIVPTEAIAIGKLWRLRGDALCKPRWHFSGRLGDACPVEEGASCYTCLEIAERLSIAEYQAS